MEEYLNLISVPAIAAVVYWVINLIKYCVGENEKLKRFIPLIATGLGIICGVICFFAFRPLSRQTTSSSPLSSAVRAD